MRHEPHLDDRLSEDLLRGRVAAVSEEYAQVAVVLDTLRASATREPAPSDDLLRIFAEGVEADAGPVAEPAPEVRRGAWPLVGPTPGWLGGRTAKVAGLSLVVKLALGAVAAGAIVGGAGAAGILPGQDLFPGDADGSDTAGEQTEVPTGDVESGGPTGSEIRDELLRERGRQGPTGTVDLPDRVDHEQRRRAQADRLERLEERDRRSDEETGREPRGDAEREAREETDRAPQGDGADQEPRRDPPEREPRGDDAEREPRGDETGGQPENPGQHGRDRARENTDRPPETPPRSGEEGREHADTRTNGTPAEDNRLDRGQPDQGGAESRSQGAEPPGLDAERRERGAESPSAPAEDDASASGSEPRERPDRLALALLPDPREW